MYDFSRQRIISTSRAFLRIVVALLLAQVFMPARADAQPNPQVDGRWSQLFRVTPGSDWTGVHSALLRGNGDTSVVLHMLSDATARVLLIPPDSILIDGASGAPSWTAQNLQRPVGSPGGESTSSAADMRASRTGGCCSPRAPRRA